MEHVERKLLFLAISPHKAARPSENGASNTTPLLHATRLLAQGSFVEALASPIVSEIFHDASSSSQDAQHFSDRNFLTRFLAFVHERVSEIACKRKQSASNGEFECVSSERTDGFDDLEQRQKASAVLVAGVACLCLFVQANFTG